MVPSVACCRCPEQEDEDGDDEFTAKLAELAARKAVARQQKRMTKRMTQLNKIQLKTVSYHTML